MTLNVAAQLARALAREQELTAILSLPETQQDQAALKKFGQEQRVLTDLITLLKEFESTTHQAAEAHSLLDNEDESMRAMAQEEFDTHQKRLTVLEAKLEEELNPSDPRDVRDAVIEVRAGTGGEEAELFASDLLRMYTRYAERLGWQVEIGSISQSDLGGVREAIIIVRGHHTFGRLKFESGVHRVQRVPETEKQGRIHTSAASVVVLPEADDVDLVINPSDIRTDVFRSSGPGGQSVNTTDSAVRLTHIPSGLVVSVQDEKSQLKNKDKAMKILRSRLLDLEEQKRSDETGAVRKAMIGTGDRSEKIRTYNYPQDRVTDHRIKQSWSNLKGILEGDLDDIVSALHTADREKSHAAAANS